MKRIGLICLALVLALGAMGVGLAQWTETLTISGVVCTGELDVDYTNVNCSDNEGAEDVATCSVTVSGADDSEVLTITIDNGYPCYTCTVDFDVINAGTIPVNLGGVQLTGVNATALGVNVAVDTATTGLAVGATKAGQITIHIEDGASETTTYTFAGTILAEQFNAP